MIDKKTKEKLEQIPYIQYLMIFKNQIKTLLDSKNKVNAISQVYAHQLGFKTRKTNIRAHKIDNTTLKTYEIIVFIFSVLDKDGKERFFEESFLLADVKLDIVLEIFFLTISNVNIDFQAWDL